MIILFTIEARAEGKGFEPSSQLGNALAGRPGKPYPATFRFEWTHRESNSDLQTASLMSSLWTMSPSSISGPPGSRTPISWLQARCRPVGPAARRKFMQRSVRDLNPVFLLTEEACRRNTYRPK